MFCAPSSAINQFTSALLKHHHIDLLMLDVAEAKIAIFCNKKLDVELSDELSQALARCENKTALINLLATFNKLNLLITHWAQKQTQSSFNKNSVIFLPQNAPKVSLHHINKLYLFTLKANASISFQALSHALSHYFRQDYPLHDQVVLSLASAISKQEWSDNLQHYPKVSELEKNTLPQLLEGEVLEQQQTPLRFSHTAKKMGVYPVVDNQELVESLLAAGTKTIQLRVKTNSQIDYQSLENHLIDAINIGKKYKARLYINDHWQVAVKHGAYGVHLGQEDCYHANLPLIAQSGLRLGISCHSFFELILALQITPSYIALGHIFPTQTKQMPSAPQGINNLSKYIALINNKVPTVAIGGINHTNLTQVKQTGVDNIALVSAITKSAHPAKAFCKLNQEWQTQEHEYAV